MTRELHPENFEKIYVDIKVVKKLPQKKFREEEYTDYITARRRETIEDFKIEYETHPIYTDKTFLG